MEAKFRPSTDIFLLRSEFMGINICPMTLIVSDQKTVLWLDVNSKSVLDPDPLESIRCVVVLKNDDCLGHVPRYIIAS